MRNRFFFIIVSSLVLASFGITSVQGYFFKSQRLNLIDRQINESSEALLESLKVSKRSLDPNALEESISEILGSARIGKVFVLRDAGSKILYQSFNVSLIKKELPVQPEWLAINSEDQYVRLRNLKLPDSDELTLQVGLVLDRNFLNWEIIDARLKRYVSGIVLALFFASVLLTLLLLSPLRLLIGHLRDVTSNLVNMKDVRPLPKSVLKYTESFWMRADEFSSLVGIVQKLINRINQNYKLTRSWTLQMAHELKTPLTIIKVETSGQLKAGKVTEAHAKTVLSEINQMSEIINQFLDWAELESSNVQKELHALRIRNIVRAVAARLEKLSPGRIQLHLNHDFSVFSNPNHLDQLITNLITNALKFSPEYEQIEIITGKDFITLKDYGAGISRDVMERLGQPFNIGETSASGKSGNGLGLAWVTTVSKLYGWEFVLNTSEFGTEATIKFPIEQVLVT